MLTIKCRDDFEKAKAFAQSIGLWDNVDKKNSLLWQLRFLAGYTCRDKPDDGWNWMENVDGELQLSQTIQKECTGDIIPERVGAELYSDFAPYSFGFQGFIKDKDGIWRPWTVGGLIFHGKHDNGGDGSAPTFSVCLEPTDGWSLHT